MDARKLPRIRDEKVSTVETTFKYIFGLLGLRDNNFPDEGETAIIEDYISNGNINFSVYDLKIAFQLYVKGKLDYYEDHYQTFSVAFIERVMQAYRRYINQMSFPEPEQEKLPEISDAEKHRIMVEGCVQALEKYRRTGIFEDYGNAFYDFLDSRGLVKMTEEEKWTFFNEAKKILRNELSKKKMRNEPGTVSGLTIELMEINKPKSKVVVIRSKRYSFMYLLQKLIDQKIRMIDFIEGKSKLHPEKDKAGYVVKKVTDFVRNIEQRKTSQVITVDTSIPADTDPQSLSTDELIKLIHDKTNEKGVDVGPFKDELQKRINLLCDDMEDRMKNKPVDVIQQMKIQWVKKNANSYGYYDQVIDTFDIELEARSIDNLKRK